MPAGGLPLRGHDIDTDRIIPARFLKCVSFEGLETHAFEDDRKQLEERGQVHAFSNPRYAGARILIVNGNFGCGSSREHAPQAIQRWGIRAVVGESFSEIFFGNSVALGMPCLTVTAHDAEALLAAVEANPQTEITVSIGSQSVEVDGKTYQADDPCRRARSVHRRHVGRDRIVAGRLRSGPQRRETPTVRKWVLNRGKEVRSKSAITPSPLPFDP